MLTALIGVSGITKGLDVLSDIIIHQQSGRPEGGRLEQFAVGLMRSLAPLFKLVRYKGYCRTCQVIADILAPNANAIVHLNSETLFSFLLSDVYWIRLVSSSYPYEPEVDRLLTTVAGKSFTFIDCGANFGYWSCLVSSKTLGAHRSIAVEPSSSTFARLTKNCELNANRFVTERAAISAKSGSTVHLGGSGHAAMSILSDDGEEVQTISIDDLLTKHGISGPLVIKLDVEGVEIEAIEGAQSALLTNPLIVYEDHGNDPDCVVSAYLIERGWNVYVLEGERPKLVRSIEEVRSVKVDRTIGYNFAAENGGDWL